MTEQERIDELRRNLVALNYAADQALHNMECVLADAKWLKESLKRHKRVNDVVSKVMWGCGFAFAAMLFTVVCMNGG